MPKLIVVGSGIKSIAHLTEESKRVIQQADKVLYLLNEDHMKEWVRQEAKQSESLESIYFSDTNRAIAYQKITDYIVEQYEHYNVLCVVFYGHPTLFADSALQAVKNINASGGDAIVLPAVSSMDCLFADLKVDPGKSGLFSIEATELLLFERNIDTYAHNIIWQIANIGRGDRKATNYFNVLREYLLEFYPQNQLMCLYEAPLLPATPFNATWFKLTELLKQPFNHTTTLYIPPKGPKPIGSRFSDILANNN